MIENKQFYGLMAEHLEQLSFLALHCIVLMEVAFHPLQPQMLHFYWQNIRIFLQFPFLYLPALMMINLFLIINIDFGEKLFGQICPPLK